MAPSRDGTLTRARARLRLPGRAELAFSVRITVAAVLSYVVATLLFPEAEPLLAPLTAMLVVQVTPASLLARGLDRVVAVVAGVSIAVTFATGLPLTWWSLGLLILTALMVGQVLRLEANLLEVAISAMLVLGVGALGAGSAAWERITETLVGAAVAVAANLLFPPKVAVADAGEAVDGFADRISSLLQRAADELEEAVRAGSDLAALPPRWLQEAREVSHGFPDVEAAVLHAEEGRRLNVRAVFRADAGPGLRQGLEALEHTAIATRVMFRGIADATEDARVLDRATLDDLALGLAQTLREMAQGVDAFGEVVRAEAAPGRADDAGPDVATLTAALESLTEARTRLEEVLVSTDSAPLLEFTASMLASVRRLLHEMDLDERLRRQMRMGRGRSVPPAPRPRPPYDPDATQGLPKVDPDAETEVFPRVRRDDRR